MTHREKASEIFRDRFNCAQAVFAAFAEELGIPEEQALKTAICFSGGMRKGEVCGAVSGALMVLGAKYTDAGKSQAEMKGILYPKANEFMDRIQSANGSYLCRDILGCDISTSDGMQYAQEHNCFHEICPKMVESAVEILEEMTDTVSSESAGNRMDAFERLEATRVKNAGLIDYEQERGNA